MPLFPPKGLMIGFAVLLLTTTTAFALDARSFGERLQSALKQGGVSLLYSGIAAERDDVVVRGAVFRVGHGRVEAGDLRFEKVTGSAERGFKVARVPIKSFGKESQVTAWNFGNVVMEDIQLAGTDPNATTPLPVSFYYRRFAADTFTTSRNGENDLKLIDMEILNDVREGGVVASKLRVGNFDVDLSLHERTDFVRAVKELGYEKFSGSASSEATWDPRTGQLEINPLRVAVQDGGTFELSTTITGVTRAYTAALARYFEDQSKIALLGPISHIGLVRYHGSYEDVSLANRLVGFYAKREGLPRAEVIRNARTIVADLLEGLDNEAFQNAIGSAVADFLLAPKSKSLTASIEPETPIPAAVILAVAVGDPERLPDVLGIKVSTNQKNAIGAEPEAATSPLQQKDSSGPRSNAVR